MVRQRPNREQARKSIKTKIVRCKRDLRQCYKLHEHLCNMVKQCDEIIKEVEIAVNEEYSRDVVNMEYIIELLENVEQIKETKERYIKNIDELKQLTVTLENGTYELILNKGHLLTRDDMVQFRLIHQYMVSRVNRNHELLPMSIICF